MVLSVQGYIQLSMEFKSNGNSVITVYQQTVKGRQMDKGVVKVLGMKRGGQSSKGDSEI